MTLSTIIIMPIWRVLARLVVPAFLFSTATYAENTEPPTVHRFVASQEAWDTNAYWIESATGIILIDSQMLNSDASKLASLIKATGKPVEAAFITHPHFDHFAGLDTLQQSLGQFPVYSTQQGVEAAPPFYKQFMAFEFAKNFEGNLTTHPVFPTKTVSDGETMTVAGVELTFHDYGPGEAEGHLLIEVPQLSAVFIGDVAMVGHPNWIGEARLFESKNQLQRLRDDFQATKTLYSGHGDPATPAIASYQLNLITDIEDAVRNARKDTENLGENGGLKRDVILEITKKLCAKYDYLNYFNYPPETFMSWNVYGADVALFRQARSEQTAS
ncbi:MBL fold metallo-hydrolase [Kordiimonas sediminis]|nr:MBL fold metallo-hydrolase [Kordiimonas sediminis]